MGSLFSFRRGDIAEAESFRQGLMDKGLERTATGQQIGINKQILEDNEIKLRSAKADEAKRAEIEKTLNRPMDEDTLLGARVIERDAPEVYKALKQHYNDTGYGEPVMGPDGTISYYQSTKAKQNQYMEEYPQETRAFIGQYITKVKTKIAAKQSQLDGGVDAEGKQMPAITNPKQKQQLMGEINRLERAKTNAMEMMGSHEKAMALLEAKNAGKGQTPSHKIGAIFETKSGGEIIQEEVIGYNPDGTVKTRVRAEAPRLASETGTDLTQDALDVASLGLLESGQMPAVGRTSRIRVQILNNVPKIAKQYGLEPKDISLAGRKMVYDSNKKALADLTSRKVQILAFEETANLNLDIVKELSKKVSRTGVPVVNAWINAGRRAVTGNVELSRFDAAIRVAINEVAKITSSATGGAVTSDTARKEFEDLLKTAQTPEQVMGVVDILQRDMANRIVGFETQTRETKEAVSLWNPVNKGGNEGSETQTIDGITYIKKDGKWYTQ